MMHALNEWAVNSLLAYGVPILAALTYLGSLGIPFPNTLVIVAAGAFTRQGLLDWRLAVMACLVGSALADNSEYWLGRLVQPYLLKRFSQKPVWKQALSTFNRQGGWAILLTRFWLMPLAPAINIISGSRYTYPRFLLFDLAGQLLWVLLYGSLGYLFAGQWQLASQAAGGFSGGSAVLAALAAGVYWLIRSSKDKQKEKAASDRRQRVLYEK